MSAPHDLLSTQTTTPSNAVRPMSSVRNQAALLRTLLDEVERVAPLGADEAVCEQLVEELARLGCRCIELASALTPVVDAREVPHGAKQQLPRCA
jgi:hypothetical protein